MEIYRTEEEKAEALREWWKKYGLFICAGIIFGIGSVFGWRGLQADKQQAAELASTNYQTMITALQNEETVAAKAAANKLLTEHDSQIYQGFAHLNLATLATRDNDLQEAETQLRNALQQISSPPLKMLARLRLARVLIYADKLDAAESVLAAHAAENFPATYAELRGDLLMRQGKNDAAREAYTQALAYVYAADQQELLRVKLSALRPQ